MEFLSLQESLPRILNDRGYAGNKIMNKYDNNDKKELLPSNEENTNDFYSEQTETLEQNKKEISIRTIILLHGFGVRGFFWEPFIHGSLDGKFHQIFAPDLDFTNINTAISSTIDTVKTIIDKYHSLGPIYLVGHSLGSVLAALCVQELGSAISKVVLLSPPIGDNHTSERGLRLQRWLVQYKLLPGFLTRPRFFTKRTPKKIQKRLWKQAIPETPELIAAVITSHWFHTEKINTTFPIPTLVIASKKDKVVPFVQSETFAKKIGAELWMLDDVGHDDLVYAPNVASKVIDKIILFCLGKELATFRYEK